MHGNHSIVAENVYKYFGDVKALDGVIHRRGDG